MNCCNRRLLLPLEEDGLMVDKIILVYHTHSLIGYKTKERNCKFWPCHVKLLIELVRCPCSDCRRPTPLLSSSFRSIMNPPLSSLPLSSSLYIVITSFNIREGWGGHEFVVVLLLVSRLISCMINCVHERDLSRMMNLCWSHIETHRVFVGDWLSRKRTNPSEMQSHG